MALYGVEATITYVAWDTSANAGKTGDAGNHTLRWVKDGTSDAPSNSPSEVDATNAPGIYKLVLTSGECEAIYGTLAGKSSTANVSIMPVSIAFEKLPNVVAGSNGGLPLQGGAIPNANADAAGGLPISDAGGLDLDSALSGNTPQTGDSYTRLGAPAGASIAADIAENQTDLDAILEDTGTTLPATLTTISNYVDCLPASLNDLDAAGIRAAVGLSSANLDTQLGDIPTVAEFEARTLVAANYGTVANQTTIAGYIDTEIAAILAAVDTEVAAIKAKTDGLNFTGDDVKATLDGEEVTTDSASRTASKADVSALALEASLSDGSVTLHGDYDAAKTAAQAGDKMDLLDTIMEDS